jgi:hypothetical protein
MADAAAEPVPVAWLQGCSRLRWPVALCLLACVAAAPAASARSTVPLHLDGHVLRTNPPAFIQGGTTMAPVRAVVQALGDGVQWTGGSVEITSHPKTFTATAVSGVAGPDGPVAPTIALTQYLAGLEEKTLDGSGPVLVRFDILDVRFDDVMITRLKGYRPRGYTYAVRLFYENITPLPGLPPSAAQLYVARTPTGTATGGGLARPSAAHPFYEDATIEVVPSGSPQHTQAANRETLTYGQSGWHADPGSLSISEIVVLDSPAELMHGSTHH